mgnify:CR=1 FL=1
MLNKCLHEIDAGYFKEFPAPMFEAMTRLNTGEMNGTTPHYGPMLYVLGKAIGVTNVLEIGVARGWSASFMAYAVLENNNRYASHGFYYGLDCSDKSHIQKEHDEAGLPSRFIQDPKGSVHFLRNQKIWTPGMFDLIFIDGWHNNVYVQKELDLVYPLLKGNGDGYVCFHDIYAFVEGAWPKLIDRMAPDAAGVMRPAWEHIRFIQNYGFGILRKMEGYDHSKVFWPSGDQKTPECDKDPDVIEASGEGN